jgi:hypothetical protein
MIEYSRISCALVLAALLAQGSFAQSSVSTGNEPLIRSQICARAAEDFMKRPQWETQLFDTQSYTSHYNNKLRKCLVNVQRIQLVTNKDEVFEMNHVYDAIEGRIVGGKLLTKKPIGAEPKVVSTVLLKGERFIRDPAEVTAALLWFDNLMED